HHFVVVVGSRNPDARTLQTVRFEKTPVVMVGRTFAGARGWIVWIGRRALHSSQEGRCIRQRFGQRAGRVLISCDGDDAVPADTSHGWLDRCQHILICGIENRAGSLRANVGCPEIYRCANARTRSTGRKRRAAIEGEGSTRCGHVRRLDVVLQRDGYSMKGTAYSAAGAFPIKGLCLLQRVWVYGNRGVQLVFIKCDSRQVL